jgi:hypothetical protein
LPEAGGRCRTIPHSPARQSGETIRPRSGHDN